MIPKLTLSISSYAASGIFDHVVDNYIKQTVEEPKIGSILYCDLLTGVAEHSGIYLGDRKIMHLNGKGKIEVVSPKIFRKKTTALSIYVSCRKTSPVGKNEFAERAKQFEKTIKRRKYNVLLDNCHQFTSACITGNPENSDNFLWMLKSTTKKNLHADNWRVWKIK